MKHDLLKSHVALCVGSFSAPLWQKSCHEAPSSRKSWLWLMVWGDGKSCQWEHEVAGHAVFTVIKRSTLMVFRSILSSTLFEKKTIQQLCVYIWREGFNILQCEPHTKISSYSCLAQWVPEKQTWIRDNTRFVKDHDAVTIYWRKEKGKK